MPTVVIADDSPTLRRIVGTVLERAGYTVVTAEDGVEAVQAVFANQPDAVILDVQMPRVSGYVAARLIKDDWQTADIPVLLLTSLDAASDRYWGRHAGADRFLTKDFEAPQLIEALLRPPQRGRRQARRPRAADPRPHRAGRRRVLGRVCDLLDRKLFEAQVAADMTTIAADVHGLRGDRRRRPRRAQRDRRLRHRRPLMLDDRSTYLTVARETSHQQYAELFTAMADAASQVARRGRSTCRTSSRASRTPTGSSVPRTRATWRRSCRCRSRPAAGWWACSRCRARSRAPSARPRFHAAHRRGTRSGRHRQRSAVRRHAGLTRPARRTCRRSRSA